ncbi:porin [Thalassotalea litorea]|uniref:porin n=1 Tax=Thalassotalea litorea TaxID=2020715 RepID=UPI00373645BD
MSPPASFNSALGPCIFTLLAFAPSCCFAEEQQSAFQSAWDVAELWKNDDGDYVNLSGRLQQDAAWFDADQGEFEDLLWRRFRFGFKSQFYGATFTLEADFNLNDSLSESYNRLTDANIAWTLGTGATIKVLKQSAGFTLDGKTSSKKLLTPQRNNLTNNLWFTAEYFSGLSIGNSFAEHWTYYAGIFSSDPENEIGFTKAGYFSFLELGRTFSANDWMDNGEVRLDYVYNKEDDNAGTRDFGHITSLNSHFHKGQWGLRTDLAFGSGYFEQPDVFGLVVMPFYDHNEIVQTVMRYTYINSDGDNGVRLGRYENRIEGDRGDEYHELFAGVNFFLNEHKFKIHVGAQYAMMDDDANDGGEYQGWGITSALRVYW